MNEAVADLARQFPLVILIAAAAVWMIRFLGKQHARELAGKDAEITRILEARDDEISRLVKSHRREVNRLTRERKRYLDSVLKRDFGKPKMKDDVP